MARSICANALLSYGWMTSSRGSGADRPASWFSGVRVP